MKENNSLAVALEVKPKDINKILVLLGQDPKTEEEINKLFIDRSTIKLDIADILGEMSLKFTLSIIAFMIASDENFYSKELDIEAIGKAIA